MMLRAAPTWDQAVWGKSLFWGMSGFLLGLAGMAVVMVLISRSIAEWREYQERGPEDPRS